MYLNIMSLDSKNFGEKLRPPCAQVSRNSWEDIRQMTKKMAQNREKMRTKLNVLKFILVLYSRPLWKRKRVSVSKTVYQMTIWKRKCVSVSTAIHFWKRKRVSRKRVSVSTAIHFRWPVFVQKMIPPKKGG